MPASRAFEGARTRFAPATHGAGHRDYHPAYLLRNLADKAKVWSDICLAREVFSQAGR